ncbi:uncharacterized protein EI97DRAFT_184882 [Westerdykella ornata]|uniref:USP domain-containing protein n=1 Tax=Westerdykella ornata TaxID=318751 RepID=A0A6A6JSY8_WESOR|nr:uncharacterized protein EI97DRAFT_184882 [Westerdykella ornata]KAF2279720.1 hypothetical protein EI97DRAFT_184882 [Westerdykella ornata]
MEGGHYYALTKDRNGNWFDCNDACITPLGGFENMAKKSRTHGLTCFSIAEKLGMQLLYTRSSHM